MEILNEILDRTNMKKEEDYFYRIKENGIIYTFLSIPFFVRDKAKPFFTPYIYTLF